MGQKLLEKSGLLWQTSISKLLDIAKKKGKYVCMEVKDDTNYCDKIHAYDYINTYRSIFWLL